MLVIGLSGGIDPVNENRFGVPYSSFHDAACVLLEDGEVTAAIEEERLNRIKHTNKYPQRALQFCLKERAICIADADCVAFGVRETYLEEVLANRYAFAPSIGVHSGRQFLQKLIEADFGISLSTDRFRFVDHHFAHACSAYYPSGFDRALVFTADGVGDSLSGSIYAAEGGQLSLLQTFPESESLGFLYLKVTRYLGYDLFDEYKVMGLAPYGDGLRFERLFGTMYELLPEGKYRLDNDRLNNLKALLPHRPDGAGFTQTDKDVAMAAQVALQTIVRHVLDHYRRETGIDDLCLAGGVALNCKMNGELAQSKWFRRIFVQPAAHDSGLALGAALHADQSLGPAKRDRRPMRHVYWGGNCGADGEIESQLQRWNRFVSWEWADGPHAAAAQMMSQGGIIGWMWGRSEFGPRALGNRSILADPRPAAHKDLINALVKKREAFRPFAPSVLQEYASEFFEIPEDAELPFMLFTVRVREQYRELLGAITHVDGSARVQTVSRADNQSYWTLIECFRQLTGIPILLNTSFNNYAEPIVETSEDGLTCLLTTGLETLFIRNWMVKKKPRTADALLSLRPALQNFTKLREWIPSMNGAGQASVRTATSWWRKLVRRQVKNDPVVLNPPVVRAVGNTFNKREFQVSEEVFRMLLRSDGHSTLGALMLGAGIQDEISTLVHLNIFEQLWERRLITLRP
jgi:carbamoyltransferase